MTRTPSIWINAGEVSGDLHAAMLVRGLREQGQVGDVEPVFRGMGGESLRAAGMVPDLPSEALSLVGFSEVLTSLPRVLGLLRTTRRLLEELRPRAVVLLDTPDYCFRVAKMASRLSIPVYFYISPQVWAWRTGRVHFLARHAKRIFCHLPFEPAFYASHGVEAEFIGHPLVEELDLDRLLGIAPKAGRIGILPGSRRREVATLLPVFAEAAAMLAQRRPDLDFRIFRAPGMDWRFLRARWPRALPFAVEEPQERYAGMRSCELLLAASGTAVLEAGLMGTPTVAAYKVAPLSFALGTFLIHSPYMTLPNLILGRQVVPEIIQQAVRPEVVARQAWRLLADPARAAAVRAELARLPELLVPPEGVPAATQAAGRIAGDLGWLSGG